MTEYLTYWFLAVGLSYMLLSFMMQREVRRLRTQLTDAETNEANKREAAYGEQYFRQSLRPTVVPPLALVWALLLIAITALGFVVVQTVPRYAVLLLFLAFQAYFVYTRFDSVEAMLFSRFISRATVEQVGRWDVEQMRWSVGELIGGRLAFFLVGLVVFFLSFVTDQLILVIEGLITVYVGFVYLVSSEVASVSPLLSVVVVVAVSAGGLVLLILTGARIIAIVRRLLSGRLNGS